MAGKGNAACRRDFSTTIKKEIEITPKFRQNFPVIRFGWYRDSTAIFRLMGIRGAFILGVLYKAE
jgi:hypothetical protein